MEKLFDQNISYQMPFKDYSERWLKRTFDTNEKRSTSQRTLHLYITINEVEEDLDQNSSNQERLDSEDLDTTVKAILLSLKVIKVSNIKILLGLKNLNHLHLKRK